jgi:mannose-6-phosphate isomerase
MGTHPSNPSKDLVTGRNLSDLFQDNEALLSATTTAKYGPHLPFLFKVLSIHKALSIQAHPNKKLAEQLHARDPKNYPDDNHKPEMAIAITPFEGLCGFRPLQEISQFLSTVPPLRSLIGNDIAQNFIESVGNGAEDQAEDIRAQNKAALQKTFSSLMSAGSSKIQAETEKLVALAQEQGDSFAGGGVASTTGATLAELVVRLNGQFGADIGLFVLFFLNFVTLQPGEALFLRADDVHAYVSGDIVECMAASDNVVRAGLTPKFKDVSTLVDMLTYNYAPIEEQKMTPTEYPYVTLNRKGYSSGSAVTLYDPPIEEFSVVRTVLRGEGSKATFEPIDGPSVLICTSGKGRIAVGPTVKKIEEGHVFFVGATAEMTLESDVGEEDEFVAFKAFCEVPSPGQP